MVVCPRKYTTEWLVKHFQGKNGKWDTDFTDDTDFFFVSAEIRHQTGGFQAG